MRRLALPALPLLLALALSGCGYRPVTALGALSPAEGVDVTLFSNRSYRAGVEGVLARDMVAELARRTGGRVLSGREAGQLLSGTVLSYHSDPVSYTADDNVREYRSTLKVEAVLREKATQRVLWKGELTEDQTYPAYPENAADIGKQQNAEDAAIDKICRRLSEEVWQKISERF